jgi:predicted alpha/beta superfamily hydrolase
VIYLLDGSIDEDFIHIAGLVQFGSFPWINLVPESIVVGIANVDRQRDFTYPTKNAEDKIDLPTCGGSSNFISFIEKELQPYISENFRCSTERTLIGQSLGGLLATEILLNKPNLFETYLIVSPSLWWDDESLINDIDNLNLENKKVFIAVGKEGEIMERLANELNTICEQSKAETTQLHFAFFPNHDHGDVLHNAVYKGFDLFKEK